jgi:hypothetical protein
MHRKTFHRVCLALLLAIFAAPTLKASADPLDSQARHLPLGAASGYRAQPEVVTEVKHDTSPPLQEMPAPLVVPQSNLRQPKLFRIPRFGLGETQTAAQVDAALQIRTPTGQMPAPRFNFDGIRNADNTGAVLPPDPNGDIGLNHFVQWVNLSLAIWQIDRVAGTQVRVYGPKSGNALWSGFGGACESTNDGDPIVLYDSLADRWFFSQFSWPNYPNGPYYTCIAVSQTADPSGPWHRYQFQFSTNKLNDYPKFGVWPDGYYMSANQFFSNDSWAGQGVVVFEREKMLAGQTARMVRFDLYSQDANLGGMLPADLDGAAPPSGAPNPFVEVDDDVPRDQLQIWNFHVDWTNPDNATFTKSIDLPVIAFDANLCGGSRSCVPQPDTSVGLDAISDRLMYRLQYRNFGAYQTLVVNHTVDADATANVLAGIRWYELRNSGSAWSVYQQSTFSPDEAHRWMGSVAMDKAGNIAIGYSISSKTIYPSIGYAGRLASDPLDSISQSEQILMPGAGSQTSTSNRWGDYSTLSVDPLDDCTFWYTNEYYPATSSYSWYTRIGSFVFPNCLGVGSLNGHITDVDTSEALPNVRVEAIPAVGSTGPYLTFSNNQGDYKFDNLPAGFYTLSATQAGYYPLQISVVEVISAQTVVQDLALRTYPFKFFIPLNSKILVP